MLVARSLRFQVSEVGVKMLFQLGLLVPPDRCFRFGHDTPANQFGLAFEVSEHLPRSNLVCGEWHTLSLAGSVDVLAIPLRGLLLNLAGTGRFLPDTPPLLVLVNGDLLPEKSPHSTPPSQIRQASPPPCWLDLLTPPLTPKCYFH